MKSRSARCTIGTLSDCGSEKHDLNDFLRRYARKSHTQGGAKTFLAIDDADNRILGFYESGSRIHRLSSGHRRSYGVALRDTMFRASGLRAWP